MESETRNRIRLRGPAYRKKQSEVRKKRGHGRAGKLRTWRLKKREPTHTPHLNGNCGRIKMHSSVPFGTNKISGYHKLFHYDNFQDISERSFTRFHKGCLFQSDTRFHAHARKAHSKRKRAKAQQQQHRPIGAQHNIRWWVNSHCSSQHSDFRE